MVELESLKNCSSHLCPLCFPLLHGFPQPIFIFRWIFYFFLETFLFGSILFINLIKTHICKFNDVWFHSSLCYFGNYPLALKPRFIHSLLLLIFCLIGGLRFSVTRNWYLYMMHYWINLFFINLIKTHDCLFNDARFHSTLCYLGNYPLAFKPRFIHSLLLLIFCVIGGLRFCANFSY